MIPERTIATIRRYADHHVQTGGFLRAVLENNLKESIWQADDENLAALVDIVRYVYSEIPGRSWGSPERVKAWLDAGEDAT